MISILRSGCKNIVLPFFAAALLIIIIVAASRNIHPYAVSVADFEQRTGVRVRLEGDVKNVQTAARFVSFDLCDRGQCIRVHVDSEYEQRLTHGRVIVSGYRDGDIFIAERLLSRCHTEMP